MAEKRENYCKSRINKNTSKLRNKKLEQKSTRYDHIDTILKAPPNHFKSILSSLLTNASSGVPGKQFTAIQTIRKLLNKETGFDVTDDLIKFGIVPILIKCVSDFNNMSLQNEAATALILITADETVQSQAVISERALSQFMLVLDVSQDMEICEQIFWILGNIIYDSPELRDEMIKQSFLPKMFSFIKPSTPLNLLKRISMVLINLCCLHKNTPVAYNTCVELLPTLNKMIKINEVYITVNSVDVISHLASNENDDRIIQNIIEGGFIPLLVRLLSHKNTLVQLSTIYAIGNIASGSTEQIQAILDAGVLHHLPALLCHPKQDICKETLWMLANITAGPNTLAHVIIEGGLIPLIVKHLNKSLFDLQKEAVWAITNIVTNCNKQQVDYCINRGVIEPLCALLSSADNEILHYILQCLKNFLRISSPDVEALTDLIEECGGLEKIESLQDHEDNAIYRQAFNIIKTFFSEDLA